MISTLVFDLPFAAAVLPDLKQVRSIHSQWIQRMGILKADGGEIEKFLSWGPERAAAHFHPKAQGEDLLLATDFYGWIIILDGQFDGPLGEELEQVNEAINALLSVLPEPGAREHRFLRPGARALADIWERLTAEASVEWRERATENLKDYLLAHRTEAENRNFRRRLPLEEYLRLRFASGGTGIILDIAERLLHLEVSEPVRSHKILQRMREICIHVTNSVQDVLSLAKEEAEGGGNNLALVLMAENPEYTRDEAIDTVRSMVRGWTNEFLLLETQVPAVCESVRVRLESRAAVYQYIDSMRSCMRGNYDWCRTSPRYDSVMVVKDPQSGYLGAMLDSATVDI